MYRHYQWSLNFPFTPFPWIFLENFYTVLDGNLTDNCCNWQWNYCCILKWLFLVWTHITPCRDAVTSSANHLVCCQDAPPVGLWAGIVANDWQESLLQDVSQRTAGCGEETQLIRVRKINFALTDVCLVYNYCCYGWCPEWENGI